MIEANVVDLPLPVVPVTTTSPLSSLAILFRTSGRFRSAKLLISCGTALIAIEVEFLWRNILILNLDNPGMS